MLHSALPYRTLAQASAEPGTVRVGESTARRFAHRFVLEPLAAIDVKGRERPVGVARLVGPSSREPSEALPDERLRLLRSEPLVNGRRTGILC